MLHKISLSLKIQVIVQVSFPFFTVETISKDIMMRFWTNLSKKMNRSGFTLIEMAVVIIIVGIVVSIVASVLPSLVKSSKIKKADAILEKGEYSIEGFITANDRCPCPDTDGDGYENFTAGATPVLNVCAAYTGDLPFLTLGYSSGNDAWGNTVKYGVYEDLVKTTSGSGANAFCTILSGIISYYQTNAPDTSKLYYTNQAGNNINQAYVIVSGGPGDLDTDGADGFFDGFNEGTDVQFDDPDRIEFHGTPVSTNYDDLVKGAAFVYLNGRDCTGTGGPGGGGSTAGEHTYPNGCSNGTDDDGDGYTDCDDQDCYGVDDDGDAIDDPCGSGGIDVTITTSSLPSGAVNSAYSVTIQATGGVIPYEWTLNNDDGLTDLFLHTYTGRLSGNLNQCPGTYSAEVEVEDSTLIADGGPKTDTESFNIVVTSDLSVSLTSGPGTNITWSSSTQEETFRASGGHLGDIEWSLNTGGATGFTVLSTGPETCKVLKNGATGQGTYSFTLTAADEDCATNTADILFSVTVASGAVGAPYSVDLIAEWRFDECSWDGTEGEVADSQGLLDGNIQNGADTAGTGSVCRAASFTATFHGVEIPDAGLLDFTGGSWTVSFWYKMMEDSSEGWDQIFVKGNGSRRNYAMWLRPSSGRIHFRVDPSNQGLDSTNALFPGKWYFITGVFDSGTLSLYINGSLDRSATGISMNASSGNNDSLYIGKSPSYNTIDCMVDEFMTYSKALTEEEISALYALTHSCSGTCYTDSVAEYYMDENSWTIGVTGEVADSSGNGNHGTPYGTVTVNTMESHIGNSAEYDSGVGYIDITGLPVSAMSGDQTSVTFWMYWDGVNSVMPMGWSSYDLWFVDDLFGFNTGGGDIDGISNASAKLANGWHHIAAVFTNVNPSANALFIDGEEQSISLLRGSQNNRSVNSGLRIGCWLNNTSYCFDGRIDEFRVYDRGLSKSEVAEDMDLTH